MRGTIATLLAGIATTIAASALGQVEPFPVGSLADRSALCSMESASGPCVVVARVRVGRYRVEVVRPRDHGTYLGDDTMKWHLYFESPDGRWGTLQPIHDEATVCTGESYERIGGYDAFELESLRAMDLAGDARPELVVRWRPEHHRPALVMICALDPGGPRCTYPQAAGALSRDPGGIRVGAQVIEAP